MNRDDPQSPDDEQHTQSKKKKEKKTSSEEPLSLSLHLVRSLLLLLCVYIYLSFFYIEMNRPAHMQINRFSLSTHFSNHPTNNGTKKKLPLTLAAARTKGGIH